jgi:hypothetical protein
MLDTIPSSVYSLLQRAHRAVDERIPAISQQQTLHTIGDERLRPTRVNGQVAFATSRPAGEHTHVLQVLTLAPDGRISEITAFLGAMDPGPPAGRSS